ncbi:protein ABCI12, chloroplastic-like [Punica granatum]|uniref:Protein ABCI12, chloroplastic-like n=1 Tax=Punica granatum TaxID=22663 RepID=A0A6P8DTG5_PUNGR|nr:protein ABCI12, chloroplastic-like [Punica granatum]
MLCANCTFQRATLAPLPQEPSGRPSISSNSGLHHWNPRLPPSQVKTLKLLGHRGFKVGASVGSDGGGTENWVNRLPIISLGPDKVFRLIANATASPICQFVPSPGTFLHSVDPRIKLVWVVALVVLPARSHIMMRFGLVVYLAFLSIWILPRHLWMDQLGRVSLLSGILFIMLGLGSDGAPALVQSKTPPAAMMGLPSLPASFMSYSYLIMKLGPLQFTRKGLSVASTAACLTFTIFQSASLCLTTTSPEQLAFALRWYLIPLTYVGVPVDEIILTLLLSLRFIHIVFDELRNVALGIVSRRINWVQLTMMETIDIFIGYIQRGSSKIYLTMQSRSLRR